MSIFAQLSALFSKAAEEEKAGEEKAGLPTPPEGGEPPTPPSNPSPPTPPPGPHGDSPGGGAPAPQPSEASRVAPGKPTAGQPVGSGAVPVGQFTAEQINRMDDNQINENWEKIMAQMKAEARQGVF